jgi:SMC interacting uncharacterized protein involved in chromosome segregation
MPELKEQEERLRFLLSKVDAEISKFESLVKSIDAKQDSLTAQIRDAGMQSVPIRITPHSEATENLYDEINAHLMDLNKLKNLLSSKLNLVLKEEELFAKLNKKYGKSVDIERSPSGEFEILYKDDDTSAAFSQLSTSKKLIDQLRGSVKDIIAESEK